MQPEQAEHRQQRGQVLAAARKPVGTTTPCASIPQQYEKFGIASPDPKYLSVKQHVAVLWHGLFHPTRADAGFPRPARVRPLGRARGKSSWQATGLAERALL
jgi:hypothetical protein